MTVPRSFKTRQTIFHPHSKNIHHWSYILQEAQRDMLMMLLLLQPEISLYLFCTSHFGAVNIKQKSWEKKMGFLAQNFICEVWNFIFWNHSTLLSFPLSNSILLYHSGKNDSTLNFIPCVIYFNSLIEIIQNKSKF